MGKSLQDVVEAQTSEGSEANQFFIVAEDARTAALLEFYLSKDTPTYQASALHPRVHVPESPGWDSVYSLWPSYSHADRDLGQSPYKDLVGIFVQKSSEQREIPINVSHAFRAMKPAAMLEVKRQGRLVHGWTCYFCFDYGGLPL